MISKSKNIIYYKSRGNPPTIISPKTDSQWKSFSNNGDVLFQWLYNGYDYQIEYRIQIFDTNIIDNPIPSGWVAKDSAESIGGLLLDIDQYSFDTNTTIDLTGLLGDGVYLWRIQTRGAVAQDWSDWSIDGRLRIDSASPVVRNICVETPDASSYMSSWISDMSMPHIYTKRGAVYDRNIDRSGNQGLYINYDYRDNSISIRCQSGENTSSRRYYGLISFHEDANSPIPSCTIPEIVKNAYSYKIKKSQTSDGPYEITNFKEIYGEIIYKDLATSNLIFTSSFQNTQGNVIPNGFPSFVDAGVYERCDASNHALGLSEKNQTFFSVFPINTTFVPKRKFKFANETSNDTIFNFVEARYPSPFHDVFILFNSSMDQIVAYGQYTMADVNSLADDPTMELSPNISGGAFAIAKGINVDKNRNKTNAPDPKDNEIFTNSNSTNSLNIRPGIFKVSQQDTSDPYVFFPRSHYMFFNIYADDDFDSAIKIYLSPEKFKIEEDGVSSGNPISHVEFHFRPDADCTLAYRDGELSVGTEIPVDEIFIGKSRISPRDLSMFRGTPTDKRIFKNIKSPYYDGLQYIDIITALNWGNTLTDFSQIDTSYNGSFRLRIPQYKYIPYYYPGAANYTDTSQNFYVIPNVLDADPNPTAVTEEINWDAIIIETCLNTVSNRRDLVIGDVVYSGDYVSFLGTARSLGQINPFLYNMFKWEQDEVVRGTFSRIRDYGNMRSFQEYANLGYTMYEDGFSEDGTWYNWMDRGFYAINNTYVDTVNNKTTLKLRGFSNFLTRKSLNVLIDEDIPYDSTGILANSQYTYEIRPLRDVADPLKVNYTYVWSDGNVLNSNINTEDNKNGPIWVYNLDDSDATTKGNFLNALIKSDNSAQGFFGTAENGRNSSWMEAPSNLFAGYYFLVDQVESANRISEQIERSIVGEYPSPNDTVMIRGKIKETGTIYSTPTSAKIGGDPLSLGNIFGYVSPIIGESQTQIIRLFFDIEDNDSGISSIKYFESHIGAEKCLTPNVFGNTSSSGSTEKLQILLQKVNNNVFDIDDTGSVDFVSALSNVTNSRSPISLVGYYLDNNISSWNSVSTIDVLDSVSGTDYNRSRFYCDISVTGAGQKIIYLKVRDKSGNESDVYSVPIFIYSATGISVEKKVDALSIMSEESIVENKELVTIGSSSFVFTSAKIPVDKDEARTVIVKSLISEDAQSIGGYSIYEDANEIVMGFSDNYGLTYNIYSSVSSVNAWRFTRPVPVVMKTFRRDFRGPDWYFDPNDIRHYTQETISDYTYGVGDNNNITGSGNLFHIPSHGAPKNVTLIGVMEESSVYPRGRSNPLADRINEFREEIIGKKLVIGSNLGLSFTVLHVFESNYLPPIKKWSSTGGSPIKTIDSDGTATSLRPKVWIMVDDPYAMCAMVLSRKFQYLDKSNESREGCGYRSDLKVDFSSNDQTSVFGYYDSQSDIPAGINSIVNDALNMPTDAPTSMPASSFDYGTDTFNIFQAPEQYFYLLPTEPINNDSGLPTNEGWISQIFQGYDAFNSANNGRNILSQLRGNQFLGLTIYNKLVFGDYYNVDANITTSSQLSGSGDSMVTRFVVSGGRFDRTMSGLNYAIVNSGTGQVVDLSSYYSSSGFENIINRISSDGKCIEVSGDILSQINIISTSYTLRVTLEPLQSIDPIDSDLYPRGWWPDIDGALVPINGNMLGSINSSDVTDSKFVKFAIQSNGAFYISEEGLYTFKVETDSLSYGDLCIDYMRTSGTITDIVESYDESASPTSTYSQKNVGGVVDNTNSSGKQFYLRVGWHIGRFSYVNNFAYSDSSYKNYARVLYSRPNWSNDNLDGDTYFVPMIGSADDQHTFMARGYRSVHARVLDKSNNKYPVFKNEADTTKASQYCRAIVGFHEALQETAVGVYSNQVLEVDKVPSTVYGAPVIGKSTSQSTITTYAGQVFEEAYGIYESSIIDGGSDFRFWRSISWTPETQPNNTTVEFYIRTASTEAALLQRTWNDVGTTTEIILDPITVPGTDILKFSQRIISTSPENPILNRFLQFKMVLKSRISGVTPQVDDVTITYSRQNTVNFFTTTFNLSSNIVRAILTYNGETPIDPSGVSLAEIQFGICTEEESNGEVKTNFEDYTIIPTNEAFSLSGLGVTKNDKFRIGIRFVSTENAVPSMDEMAMMWETDGSTDRTRDLKS